LYVIQIIMWY